MNAESMETRVLKFIASKGGHVDYRTIPAALGITPVQLHGSRATIVVSRLIQIEKNGIWKMTEKGYRSLHARVSGSNLLHGPRERIKLSEEEVLGIVKAARVIKSERKRRFASIVLAVNGGKVMKEVATDYGITVGYVSKIVSNYRRLGLAYLC